MPRQFGKAKQPQKEDPAFAPHLAVRFTINERKPIRIEEFEGECAWWGDENDSFKARLENEQAWRVSIDTIKAGNFNLDLKNPHKPDTGAGDVDHLLPEYEKLLAQIAETRAKLKQELRHALTITGETAE